MSDALRHLTDDQIQDWLDGRLPPSEVGRLEAHLDECARCRAETEGWSALTAELSALPTLAPAPGFSGRVLDALARPAEERLPLAARVRALVGGGARRSPAPHPDADRMQDLLDGVLSGRAAASVRGHLTSCEPCRREAQALGHVFHGLGALERFAPSSGFAEAVMASVKIPEPAPARAARARRFADRVRALAGPHHRKAWAAAAGVALAPSVTLALVAYAVFSHPLVTVGSLTSFLWIKGGEVAAALGGGLFTTVVESAALLRAWGAVGSLARSPTTAGIGLLGFSLLTLASAWVLYRNLFAAPAARAYAKSA